MFAAVAAAIAVRRPDGLFPVRVAGASMEPTLSDGDFVAVSRGWVPQAGDVVVVRDRGREMIKRVTAVNGGNATLEGDHHGASSDLVAPIGDIAGVALFRYRPRFRLL